MPLKVSRREFVGIAISYVAATTLFGIAEAIPNHRLIRPPGALPDKQFLQMCVRCGACSQVCPARTLKLADLTDGLRNIGTPKLDGYCMIFKGLQNPNAKNTLEWKKNTRAHHQEETCFECINVCPSGALVPTDAAKVRMGIALVDKNLCLAWLYATCSFPCVDACPFDAISITIGPVVDANKCVGCNLCSIVCLTRQTGRTSIVLQPTGA